jgi:hypothetical protein
MILCFFSSARNNILGTNLKFLRHFFYNLKIGMFSCMSKSKFNYFKSGTSSFIALTLSAATFVSVIPTNSVSAQVFKGRSSSTYPNSPSRSSRYVIPEGTTIPLKHDKEKILVTKNETVSITLKVAGNVKNRQGVILIPANSEIVGQIEPTRNGGSRFVAEKLIIDSGREEYDLQATSDVVTKTERVGGTNVEDVVYGAAAGAGAAAAIAAVAGDRKISAIEVLAGAGSGALLGGLLAGTIKGDRAELVSIDPNQDLDITLNRDLAVDSRYANNR